MSRFQLLTALFVLGACTQVCTQSLQAQTVGGAGVVGHPTEIVDWSFSTEVDPEAGAGDRVILKLAATIDDDWKMYAMDSPRPSRGVTIRLEALPAGVERAGDDRQAAPKRAYDQNFDMEVTYFQGSALFAVPLRIAPSAQDSDSIRGDVVFQICSDSRGLCLPPTPQPFSVAVSDAKGCLADAAAADAECEAAPLDLSLLETAPVEENPDFPVRGRFGGFILLALAAGFGALLTPCVFPMLPLTVSYFTKHTESRRQSFSMAMLFGASIVVTFTLLGMVMAVVVGAAGAQTIAANPWVNLFIAGTLIAFAFSLIGFYELRLPSSWVNFASNRKTGPAGGVLFMAITLTLVSFSCTAPFVGGLLAAAAGGTWIRPIVGMVAFSAAFASPFVVLATFPRLLESLPRSGSWMNAVKVTLGFIELAAAIKFLSNADLVWGWNLISRPLAVAVTVLILVATALYLFGRLPVPHEPARARVGAGRMLFGAGFLALGLYLAPAILGAQRTFFDPYFPPRRATDIAILAPERGGGDADEGWIVDDPDAAIEAASLAGLPVFVDFTGYSCTNCRQMESSVFPNPAIAESLETDFVRLKLYTDGLQHGPDLQRYQIRLTGTVALPTYAIVSPLDGRLIERVSGVLSVSQMAAFLAAGKAEFERRRSGEATAYNR